MVFYIIAIIVFSFLSPLLARDKFKDDYILDRKGVKLLHQATQKTTEILNTPDFLSKKYGEELLCLTLEQRYKIVNLKKLYSLQEALKEIEGLYIETCETVKKLKEITKKLFKIVYEGKALKNSVEKSLFFYHVNRLIRLPHGPNQEF